jgi:hypothetical protein
MESSQDTEPDAQGQSDLRWRHTLFCHQLPRSSRLQAGTPRVHAVRRNGRIVGPRTVTDNKSDIIIRGGENISALEVEEALLGMPSIAEAAAVAAPNARLGEHTAAVVRVRPGSTTPTISDIRAHFPRTATGKVQKAKPATCCLLSPAGSVDSDAAKRCVHGRHDKVRHGGIGPRAGMVRTTMVAGCTNVWQIVASGPGWCCSD